jgi:predicted RNA polymerase sigma factor
MKLRRYAEARQEIERAIALTQNSREQKLLHEKVEQIQKLERGT